MEYIPEEILKWFPTKTLIQSRCVCKWWKEIIDSPLFMQQHLAVQNSRIIVKCAEQDHLLVLDPISLPSIETLSLPSTFLNILAQASSFLRFSEYKETDSPPFEYVSEPRLVGTLHGVVCVYDNFYDFHIWNPSIHKSTTIHAPALEFDWDDDTIEELPYFGFWIDPLDRNFKIIVFKLVYAEDTNGLVDAVLYSSINHKWKSLPLDQLKDLRPYAESPPVIIDGVAYWRANYEETDEEGDVFLQFIVFSFDFVDECFDIIKVPGHLHYNGRFYPILCSVRNTLALVYWELKESDRSCVVHIWKKAVWVKTMTFELSLAPEFRVLWVLGETERKCRVIAENGGELVLYDTRKNNIDVMKSGLRNSATMYLAYGFIESLLFPEISDHTSSSSSDSEATTETE